MVDPLVFKSGVFYLGTHLLFYILVLRHTLLFSREKVIFFYHASSALAMVCILLGIFAIVPQSGNLISAVGVMSLHGIYSLSFLELWSLAEGSYSLTILDRVDAAQAEGVGINLAELQRIGASKKKNRIEGLQRLRLVRRQGERFSLTVLGRLVALGLCIIARAVDLKKMG